MIIVQPQIINGGQTAYTLSRLYEDYVLNEKEVGIFDNKEVLLKIITFHPDDITSDTEYLTLIEEISKATNQQSEVKEADRRSNDQIQIQLQKHLFEKYGWFYERKRGEYADGVRAKYIHRSQIIDREIFLRMCKCSDVEPSDAKRMSANQLFDKQHFERTLLDPNRFDEYYFAYLCFVELSKIKKSFSRDKENKFGFQNYGNGLQNGIYAVVTVCGFYFKGEVDLKKIQEIIEYILNRWVDFEKYAQKQEGNDKYFRMSVDPETAVVTNELNFVNYYKGSTLAKNLLKFFKL